MDLITKGLLMSEKKQCEVHGERCPYAEDAADSAVRKVFAILGVDVEKPESVEQFREDLRFGGKMRRVADHGMLAVVGLIVVALGAALWAGIVAKVKAGL
jgi:TusA-related sulfurtransferase